MRAVGRARRRARRDMLQGLAAGFLIYVAPVLVPLVVEAIL